MTSTFSSYLWFDLLFGCRRAFAALFETFCPVTRAVIWYQPCGLPWLGLKERIKSACFKLHVSGTLLSYMCAKFECVTTSQPEVLLNLTYKARERRILPLVDFGQVQEGIKDISEKKKSTCYGHQTFWGCSLMHYLWNDVKKSTSHRARFWTAAHCKWPIFTIFSIFAHFLTVFHIYFEI